MKKKYVIAIVALAAIIIAGEGIWGYSQYNQKTLYYRYIDGQTKKKYYDLVGSVETISSELSKLMVSTQKKENIVLYSRIWQNAYAAQDYLTQMPINHPELSRTEKFLSQLGDYTFAMAQKSIKGVNPSSQDISSLEKLYNYSLDLSASLHNIKQESVSGDAWKKIFNPSNDLFNQSTKTEVTDPFGNQFRKFEERMTQYPELIYDGPFADNVIKGLNPKLQGAKITQEQAKKIVQDFLGAGKIKSIQAEKGIKARLVTYSFAVNVNYSNQPIYMDVTELGGHVAYILSNKTVNSANISRKQAVDIATKFLVQKGYPNMIPTYSLKSDNTVLINYAYQQNGVIMYPDLIKVRIALDDGGVIGFDSTNYLTNHFTRDTKTPLLSTDEARGCVSSRAEIIDAPKLCYIPTSYGKELYCYEIKVKRGTEPFLVYINADTGAEEKILKMLINENGTLMI